jgi:hypothetical protein
MRTWEYLSVTFSGLSAKNRAVRLQILGIDGWELAAIDTTLLKTIYVFKRPLLG